MALTLPDPRQIESLKDRALRGKDLLFLRQWTGLSIADCCYLLGMPVVRWHLEALPVKPCKQHHIRPQFCPMMPSSRNSRFMAPIKAGSPPPNKQQ